MFAFLTASLLVGSCLCTVTGNTTDTTATTATTDTTATTTATTYTSGPSTASSNDATNTSALSESTVSGTTKTTTAAHTTTACKDAVDGWKVAQTFIIIIFLAAIVTLLAFIMLKLKSIKVYGRQGSQMGNSFYAEIGQRAITPMGPFEFFENNELSPYARTTMAVEKANRSIMTDSDTENNSTVLDLKPRVVHEESLDDVDADMNIVRASTTLSDSVANVIKLYSPTPDPVSPLYASVSRNASVDESVTLNETTHKAPFSENYVEIENFQSDRSAEIV